MYSMQLCLRCQNSDLAVIKSGKITSSLAAGVSYTYEIAFKTPFTDTNYVIKLELNTSAYTYYVSEKTISGFKLFVYADNAASGVSIFWEATRSKDFQ